MSFKVNKMFDFKPTKYTKNLKRYVHLFRSHMIQFSRFQKAADQFSCFRCKRMRSTFMWPRTRSLNNMCVIKCVLKWVCESQLTPEELLTLLRSSADSWIGCQEATAALPCNTVMLTEKGYNLVQVFGLWQTGWTAINWNFSCYIVFSLQLCLWGSQWGVFVLFVWKNKQTEKFRCCQDNGWRRRPCFWTITAKKPFIRDSVHFLFSPPKIGLDECKHASDVISALIGEN